VEVTDPLARWVVSSILLSFRISPIFALAPPFSLTRMPVLFRAFLGLGLAATLVSSHPETTALVDTHVANLIVVALRELMVGFVFVVAFQLAYGGLYLAGRTIDIQAGFGLAALIDPATRGRAPLVGTLFALAAGAVFFAMDGHLQVLRLLTASLEAAPLGAAYGPSSLSPLLRFIAVVFVTAFGVAGATILGLLIVDLAISALSRTVPQMNVLVMGFQVKTLVLLVLLPTAFGAAGSLFARTATLTLEAIPRLL
jgi:flagellar biosynthesis protein FliR